MSVLTRRNKHNNKRVDYDGYTFDSLMEMRRYKELRLLEAAGEISRLKVHPSYELQPGYKHPETGRKVRAIVYIADFEYVDQNAGLFIVEDVKGHETAVFKLKRKLFEFKFAMPLRTVQA